MSFANHTKNLQFSFYFRKKKSKNEIKQKNFSRLDRGSQLGSNTFFEKNNFWNLSFDKGRIKVLVSWFLKNYGQKKTIQLVENLKTIGFEYATKAGISLGIDDLKISPNKAILIAEAEKQTYEVLTQYKRAQITGVERFQRLIDTWHRTSENLKQEVINYFEITDLLNPVYMMAFSGARGNISQVRQLVGMRGLMADPKGQILDFPIRSNFREGLTLTEYLISSYGARKGIVDTALRTANAGYLTRRLVDVAQHLIVSHYDCGTKKGILISDMKEGNKILYSLQNRLIGRVLAQDIVSLKVIIAARNQEISSELAGKISKVVSKVLIRSALTCETRKLICQLCYGWGLGQGKLVSIGDAVGVIAAQSIGEPGTQLTMRTFHTGGVFSSDVNDQILGPYDGIIEYFSYIPGTLVRTPQGKIAFLTKAEGSFLIKSRKTLSTEEKIKFFKIPAYTLLFCRHNEKVYFKQVVAQICSSSTQNKQRDDAEQSIQTELQGQVYMDQLTLIEQTNDYEDTNQQSWDWGYLWILSGKIYEIPVDSSILPKFGDFLNQNSILNQIQWMVPDKSELTLKLQQNLPDKGSMNQFDNLSNNKLPNKKNQKLLQNLKLKKHPSLVSSLSPPAPYALSVKEDDKLFNYPEHLKKLQTSTINEQSINFDEAQNFMSLKKLNKNLLAFKVIKEKFQNISFLNKSFRSWSFSNQFPNTHLKFSSDNLVPSFFITKKNSVSTEFKFKRPLLLLDTEKFSYKKLGYFFKVNIPFSISKIHLKNFYNKAHFLTRNDKFFIPVNLQFENKLFTTNFFKKDESKFGVFGGKKLQNSFDWKIFPHTLLTWFPSFYETKGSSLISYEIYTPSPFTINHLDHLEYLVLKQKNPSVYYQILKNFSQFALRNLKYKQTVYNKLKNKPIIYNSKNFFSLSKTMHSSMQNLNVNKIINYKKFWFFSEKQEKKIFKSTSNTLLFKQNQILQHSNFKQYTELRWKNSKTFHNKDVCYRGRIFWIPHQIYKFLALENNTNNISFHKKKYSNDSSLNWHFKDSFLYYNLTRQGKKIPVSSVLDGFLQIYHKPIFTNSKPNINFSSSKVAVDYDLNYGIDSNKKILKLIKQYNKKYYIALKFKANKINFNHQNFKNLIVFLKTKHSKKVAFLKSFYLTSNSLVYNSQLIENKFTNQNTLSSLNYLRLKNIKNSQFLSSIFKFSFLNLNSYSEKLLIFDNLKPRLSKLVLQIQAGWVYIPKQLSVTLINYNKSIIPLGKILCDDIIFDRQLVYLECVPIKPNFLKYNLNFLNNLRFLNGNYFSSRKSIIYQSVKQRHKSRIKLLSSLFISSLMSNKNLNPKFNLRFKNSLTFSINNLKWVSTLNLRNWKPGFKTLSSVDKKNKKYKFSSLSVLSSFGKATESILSNISSTKLNLASNKQINFDRKFLLIIKKVYEYNIQEISYYKNNLYNSQITNFNTNFSFLLKQNYHTFDFNKQLNNIRLISKFPNVALNIEPIFKVSSTLSYPKQYSLLSQKKPFTYSLNTSCETNLMKVFFYNTASNLLYFKLDFVNNSTLQMYYKKPIFSFNYINSPNFSTSFSSYFNFMYVDILQNLVSIPSNFGENNINFNAENLFQKNKKLSDHLSKMTLFFSSNLSKLFSTPFFDFSLAQKPFYFFNQRFFAKTRLTQLFSQSNIKNVGLSISFKKSVTSSLTPFPRVKNSYIFKTHEKLLETQPFAYSSFLSPYEGELLLKKKNNWNTNFQKNRLLILTKTDLVSFNLTNLLSFFYSEVSNDLLSITKNTSIHENIFIKFSKKVYNIDNLVVTEPKIKNIFVVGKFVYYGDPLNENMALSQAGQVVHLSQTKLTIRKGQSIFLSSKAILHAYNGDLIDKNFPVVTLPYQKLKAGDIVQGIPKIEQFFEARITRRGRLFRDSIPNLLKGLFKRYKLKYPLLKAVRQSFYKIQQILVDGVQRVYGSQGVTIADKHIEIIVKQMTCKVKIINGGQTGFFPGELVDLEFVEQINKILMNKVYYEPVVLGITKASLEVESFLSSASFQQTTRMLSKAAIARKKDFLKGLKENVIVGNLIPSGTGYLIYLQDSNKNFKI